MDRSEKAVGLFKSGYNCAQAVVGAYAEDLGMDMAAAMRAAEGFGGGMGRMRLTCGAVSAMAFLCGLRYSKGRPGDIETRTTVYKTIREMAAEFEKTHGSVICADMLKGIISQNEGARPDERTDEYYKKRPCIGCIRDAARIAGKYLT